MRTTILCLAALLGGGCRPALPASPPETPAPVRNESGQPAPEPPARRLARDRAWVIFGPDTVEVEVARTQAESEQGLQGRTSVPDGTGMLFVFQKVEVKSFWMENTPVDLDIAFFDTDLAVIDVQSMEKETTTPHDSAGPAKYALEVRKGWFADHGIRVGARAELVLGPR